MDKLQFRTRLLRGACKTKKYEPARLDSVTDATYAQTGRQIVFNPLPYETKPIYSQGIPADKMQAFDGMYKDKFEAFQAAKEFSENQKQDLKKKINEHTKQTTEETK